MKFNSYKYDHCRVCGTEMKVEREIVNFKGLISKDLVIIVCPYCRSGDAVFRQNRKYRLSQKHRKEIDQEKQEEKKISLF